MSAAKYGSNLKGKVCGILPNEKNILDTLPIDYLDECGYSENFNFGTDDLNSFLLSNEVEILNEILNDLKTLDPQWNDIEEEELFMSILSNTTELNKCCKHQKVNSIECVVEDIIEQILFHHNSKKLQKVNVIGKLFGASPLIKNILAGKGSSTLKDLACPVISSYPLLVLQVIYAKAVHVSP